ncbi:RNA polymerase sigma factor [Methylopila musalis]|uniref:RNA polymerase sigma factor n=1 Tax=Methylopila musalis TaxID=1134781 RepID=A0ABW3Z443_9HYPH
MTIDTSHIASLYAAEQGRLKRMLMRRGMSAQSAADAVQDAFIKLLRSPTADVRDLRGYLRRTTETAAVDLYRDERRVARIVDPAAVLDEAVADPTPLADSALIAGQELADLAAALNDLPPRTREVLVLHKFEGLSYQEIAERLGIARNTVMVHMVKALGRLKASMRENNSRSD